MSRRPLTRTLRLTTVATAGAVLCLVGNPAPSPAVVESREAQEALAQARAGLPAAPVAADRVNDEIAVATLSPTGLPDHAVLISRLTAHGPAREIDDPASVTNVRYLDRLGRPEVTADGVRLFVGGDRPVVLTEARFDKPLPMAVHVEYALNGQVLPAADVPGADGDLTITYTLTNTTAQQTELSYEDAAGQPHTTEVPVFAPFQGTLTVTLPEDAVLIDGGGAILATDESGRTIAQWNVSLFPPISQPIQRVSLTMHSERAGVPAAQVQLTPAATDQSPPTQFSDDLLAGTTEGSTTTYEGLSTLNQGASQLATGSTQLADGLTALSQGADQAAGASGDLAGGVDELADGAAQVADGSGELADALDEAATGADALAKATGKLAAASDTSPADELEPLIRGGAQIEKGLREATARIGSEDDPVLDPSEPIAPDDDTTCPAGGTAPPDDDCVTIYQGVRALRDGLAQAQAVAAAMGEQVDVIRGAAKKLGEDLASIATDAGTAAQTAQALYASLCLATPPILDAASCAQLQVVAEKSGSAASTAVGDAPVIKDLVVAAETLDRQAAGISAALESAVDSADRLLVGIDALGLAVGQGTSNQPGLTAGMAALNAGLAELATALDTGQQQLHSALTEVAKGSDQLATGVDAAAGGADDLADGSDQLASGTAAAATGADQLASGLDNLATGTDSTAIAGSGLAAGADQLYQEGTEPAVQSVLDASTDPALAQAWLTAASARAADALPYGPPEAWTGHVAYVFTLDQVDAPRSLLDRIRDALGL